LNEPFKDHSQGQLGPILQLLNFPKNGYFIELAANDYESLSNSYDLEYSFNWTGLCIEPNPLYHQNILEHRKCTLIINPIFDKAGILIEFNFNEGLGGIIAPGMDNEKPKKGKVVKLPTVTFQQILTTFLPHSPPNSSPKVIDYLSLDVEGGEYEVMMGVNLNEFRFRVISIERPCISY
jgi:hypothetical protein